jgi:hypothetical protein
MKHFIYIILFLVAVSCDSRTNNSLSQKTKSDSILTDSVLILSFESNFKNSNISNNSDRQVDVLFNGVNKYLGGHKNSKINFTTECMRGEPIQEYQGGLLFSKRLLITSDDIKFYKKDINIPDSINRIKQYSGSDRKNSLFKFTNGKVSIKYIGVSCNDADFNKVKLSFPTGEIIIDSLINATFFEHDLNKDGHNEQYLLGSRSCSQELVILRVGKPNLIK